MKLYAEQTPIFSLYALDKPIGCMGVYPQALSHILNGLQMKTIGRHGRCPHQTGQQRSGLNRDIVRYVYAPCALRRVSPHAKLSLHIGKERAAQARVDKLHPIANAQHRSPFFLQHVKSDTVGLPAVQIDGGKILWQLSTSPSVIPGPPVITKPSSTSSSGRCVSESEV